MVRKISKRKYKHKFYGGKKKISIRFFYNFLILAIVCLSLFLVISIYFSAVDYIKRSEIIAEKKEMQFMFIDWQWTEHNITQEASEHWASSKRDYLFQDYSTGEIIWTWTINSSWTFSTWKLLTWTQSTWSLIKNNTWTNKILLPPQEKLVNKLDVKNNTLEKDSDIPKKSCTTPRWKIIGDSKFVLAYQQRQDVPDICNIQRRTCNDWVLGWSFTQKSCKTDIPYTYTTDSVILYNEKKIDPLIQPWNDLPINKGENFDNNGQINGVKVPDTVRNNTINESLESGEKTVNQIEDIQPNCISPRWDIVLNWQFVKAYMYKNWFINHPCEVQLRPCMQWSLEWTYKNASCKHRDIAFEDFMNWYFKKEQPSIQRIIETLNTDIPENEVVIEKPWIWNMISNLRN